MTEDVNELVKRVTQQVVKEMRVHEAEVFGVQDLKSYLADLGQGGESAWEVTYKTTSGGVMEKGLGVAEGPGISAWEISYKTTSAPDIEQIRHKK